MGGFTQEHNKLVGDCIAMLEAYKIPCRMVEHGRGYRKFVKRGRLPDIVAALPPTGRITLLEIKTGSAVLTDEQERCFEVFLAAGAMCLEVRSLSDLDPIREAMRERAK